MYMVGEGAKSKHELHIHSIKAHRISRLTRRDEGVLDCIALDEVTPYAVHTLNDVSVERLHTTHSTDCHSVLCLILECIHCTRECCAKDFTTIHCPIVYPVWVIENTSVSTDEGELV